MPPTPARLAIDPDAPGRHLASASRRAAAGLASGAALVLLVLAAALPASAADLPADDREDAVEGPQFFSGTSIDVTEDVDGDVYAVGQSVTVSGDVTGDVIVAAQSITISGTVDGDVRLAGQAVAISGDVLRSGTIVAEDLELSGEGSVGVDVVAAAARVTSAGEVGRDMVISVGALVLDGPVGGDVTYVSDQNARVADGAVGGAIDRVEPPPSIDTVIPSWIIAVGWAIGPLLALISLSLVTLMAGLLIPRLLQRVTDELVPRPWKALLVGLIAALVVPIGLTILLVTVIGAPLAIIGAAIWITLTAGTFVFGAHYLGRLVLRDGRTPVVTSVVGGVILIVGFQIPGLSVLVWFAMVLLGLGAQLLRLHGSRPWRLRLEDAAAAPGDPATISIGGVDSVATPVRTRPPTSSVRRPALGTP